MVLPPNHELNNRVFDYLHHPFLGAQPYFWFNTHTFPAYIFAILIPWTLDERLFVDGFFVLWGASSIDSRYRMCFGFGSLPLKIGLQRTEEPQRLEKANFKV